MTFFEQELKKIFRKDMGLSDIRIVGNACYGRLSGDIRMKAAFATGRVADQYEMLKITMINRREGQIDSVALHFSDLWGRKKVDNPNFRDGICLSDGKLMETQTANYFSDIYPIDCAVLSANA